MFELYNVPSLAYGVDSIMSFYHNNLPTPPVPFTSDGIVVSFNTASTSVIPILNGKGLLSHAKRLMFITFSIIVCIAYLLSLYQNTMGLHTSKRLSAQVDSTEVPYLPHSGQYLSNKRTSHAMSHKPRD